MLAHSNKNNNNNNAFLKLIFIFKTNGKVSNEYDSDSHELALLGVLLLKLVEPSICTPLYVVYV